MWINARIEENCQGDEFFLANISFDKIYKKAAELAKKAFEKSGLSIDVRVAAHSLMLHPRVRQYLDKKGIDYYTYNIYLLNNDILYLVNPTDDSIISHVITDNAVMALVE